MMPRSPLLVLLPFLSGCTEPNPSYQRDGAVCLAGQRACSGTATMMCTPQQPIFVVDRTCPPETTCSMGRCVPASTVSCQGVACPLGSVCTVFVDPTTPGQLGLFCARTMGKTPGGASCTRNEECDSDLCLLQIHRCYRSCLRGQCGVPGLRCQERLGVTVDGAQGTVPGCAPWP